MNQSSLTPVERYARAYPEMSESNRFFQSNLIIALGVAAAISGGIMKYWRARILFAAVTILCFVLVYNMADRVPREAVTAGIILGFVLAIITVIIWLGGPPPPEV